MANGPSQVWLACGLRTPFVRVDGALAARDQLTTSVPVAQAMAQQVNGAIDLGVWGAVALNLAYSNLAREIWLEAKLDPHVTTFTTIMQCCTSMNGAFEAAGMLGNGRELGLVGGVESMSRVQFGLGQNLSVWLRRIGQARNAGARLSLLRQLRPADIRLYVPRVQNRVTGRSMGEHCEDMAKTWNVSRQEQDELALASHRGAVDAQDRGFFEDLIVPVDGHKRDDFPRRDTSLEKLARLHPAFDTTSGRGTLTAGNSSPLTDGAAGVWVATEKGLARLPGATPRVRLVDFEVAAFNDIALWEIHEAFSAQVACHIKGLEDAAFVKEKSGVDHTFGKFPRERMNPNGGSVALGHPFAATGARILSQAVKELAAMPAGSRAIVSICADGGEGTVALLEN